LGSVSSEPQSPSIDLSSIPRRAPRMVSRVVSGEHILVPLASRGADLDFVFNLNATGTFIWERIDGVRSGEEIASLMAAEFQLSDAQAAADCRGFLEGLLEARAIEFAERG
jgi:hypothetical protein